MKIGLVSVAAVILFVVGAEIFVVLGITGLLAQYLFLPHLRIW